MTLHVEPLDRLIGQLVVLGDCLSERRIAGKVVDQVEQEPPPALAPELGEVAAGPERQISFYRLAVPFEEVGEPGASPGVGSS